MRSEMLECRLVKGEDAQWSIERADDGSLLIPGVQFANKREAQKVLDALMLLSSKLPEPVREGNAAPNTPEFHESKQAVRGQAPRA